MQLCVGTVSRSPADWTEMKESGRFSHPNVFMVQVESPIFQDLPRLPSPLGTFVYTQVSELPHHANQSSHLLGLDGSFLGKEATLKYS